ncbi:uncharacterized protein LOC128709363 [Anopheles marshallii]|uniref:uncharacterized protein LOC128709363 n=1 Tax=Anopheles marshallii TaxID=1521116 RepID=UPI00237A5CEA|nr:uncharacterized protein LOC128709363 [Anopheles marshallii]
MKLLRALLLLTILLFSFHWNQADAFVKLVIFATKVELKNNNKTFDVSYAFQNPTSLSNQTLNFEFVPKHKINNLKLKITYNVIALNGNIQNELVKRTLDICFFLQNPRSDRLIKSFFDYIKQTSHLPSRCPIPVDNYNMRNLRLATVPLPAFLPESEFMLETAYFSGVKQEITLSFRLYGKLVRVVKNILPTLQ